MAIRNTSVLCGLFFMAIGSVYSGPAIGAEPGQPAEGDPVPQGQVITGNDDDEAASDQAAPAPQEPAGEVAEPGEPEMQPLGEGAPDPDLPEGQQVEVGSFGQIDLHVKDLELAKVLQLLSIQSQRNIVASRSVSGTISADLYDVGFYEALDAILHTNGFGYREEGNFIYVYTQEELAQMEQAQRQKETQVVRLNYITASDASAFVSPMLSSNGSISVSGEAPQGMQPSVSDAGANTYAHSELLVIRDYPENLEQIVAVLEDLDERPKQVQIEATVLEARLTEDNAFGVDFALFSRLGVDSFTQPLGSIDELIDGDVTRGDVGRSGGAMVSSPGEFPDGTSAKLGFMSGDAAVFVRALESVTDTTVVARPQMLVLNRQRADLLVGRREGYLSTTTTETAATQTVEFLDIGTQLTVRPFVSDDGFVRLELRPEVSSGGVESREGVLVPETNTQELTTNVMVRSGQTVVLGGLFKERTDNFRRQVPFLGDVPLLGNAFRGRNDNVSREEVIFLIKPTVIKDEVLYADAERARETKRLAQVGAREGLLPWSRTKLTSSHLRRAYQHKRQDEIDKALWHTNMTLHLHPSNVEALRLKERLTGQRMIVEDEGVLRDAVDAAVDEYAPDLDDPDNADAEPAEPETETDEPEARGEAASSDDRQAQADQSLGTPRQHGLPRLSRGGGDSRVPAGVDADRPAYAEADAQGPDEDRN